MAQYKYAFKQCLAHKKHAISISNFKIEDGQTRKIHISFNFVTQLLLKKPNNNGLAVLIVILCCILSLKSH